MLPENRREGRENHRTSGSVALPPRSAPGIHATYHNPGAGGETGQAAGGGGSGSGGNDVRVFIRLNGA